MKHPAYKLRPTVHSLAVVEADPLPEAEVESELDGPEHDPFYYGWRPVWEKAADGEERQSWIPLTYQDLLDPQEDDVVAEGTIHRKVTDGVAGILRRRFQSDPTVAVWCNLKIWFVIPGLTTGPGPDICVVAGVEDRDRGRTSFRYGEEPGTVRLVIEIVSKSSAKKDYQDLLRIYAPMGVEEYVAVHPLGPYSDGPFRLRGWRLDPRAQKLRPIAPDRQGRIPSRTTGLLFGTGQDGWHLTVWDAANGELLEPPEIEAAWQELRIEQAEERAERAEERAEREAAARRAAEAELERLRAQIEKSRQVDDA
jgi:Uma2 family endonuclease